MTIANDVCQICGCRKGEYTVQDVIEQLRENYGKTLDGINLNHKNNAAKIRQTESNTRDILNDTIQEFEKKISDTAASMEQLRIEIRILETQIGELRQQTEQQIGELRQQIVSAQKERTDNIYSCTVM
jgi:septal ring factor EnvC (AmiA/AmiB activator)